MLKINGQSAGVLKKLAYIIGLLLTDGWFSEITDKHTIKGKIYSYKILRMGIGLNDKELVLKFQQNINQLFGRELRLQKLDDKGKMRYSVTIQHKPTVRYLYDLTEGKVIVPKILMNASDDIKRELIAGAMDGDGWISISKDRRKFTHPGQQTERRIGVNGGTGLLFMMGFSGNGEHFDQILKCMEDVGIKLKSRGYKRNKHSVTEVVNMNIVSFINSGCYFECFRKQARLTQYKKLILRNSPETTKDTPTKEKV